MEQRNRYEKQSNKKEPSNKPPLRTSRTKSRLHIKKKKFISKPNNSNEKFVSQKSIDKRQSSMGLFVFCNMILLELWVMSLKNGNGGLSGGAGRRRGTPKKNRRLMSWNMLRRPTSRRLIGGADARRRSLPLLLLLLPSTVATAPVPAPNKKKRSPEGKFSI